MEEDLHLEMSREGTRSTTVDRYESDSSDCEHLMVGAFYEIDHSELPTKCPDQLKFVRVTMVSEKTRLKVSLRYPSSQSLCTYFKDISSGEANNKKTPALNEKYVMASEVASQALYRRIPALELAEKRISWGFWAKSNEQNQRKTRSAFSGWISDPLAKKGSCLSLLRSTQVVQWGERRKVRFLSRHEEQESEPFPRSDKENEKRKVVKQSDKLGKRKKRLKESNEENETEIEDNAEVTRTRKSKRIHDQTGDPQSAKKTEQVKQNQLALYRKSKKKPRKCNIDRWSAERYKLAETNMLKVLKAKGAVFGNPILRPDLRTEARKLIGDTGLLDHLLKHMAGKVAPGGTERFRRRHNAEGAMEYWLESADLAHTRKEAGIQDSYWIPPPGWKPGDNPALDPLCAKALEKLWEEMTQLKQENRETKELVLKRQEGELAIVDTPNSCVSNPNTETDFSIIHLKEMYMELSTKHSNLEEQMMEVVHAMSGIKEQLRTLNTKWEEPTMTKAEAAQLLSPVPTTEADHEGHPKEKERDDQDNSSGVQPGEKGIQKVASPKPEDKATRIERLKSGFKFYKTQGSYLLSNTALCPNLTVHSDDKFTPASVISSATSAANLAPSPQPSHFPGQLSTVKPFAERRPVSTYTLSHMTNVFLPPSHSPPLHSPNSKTRSTNEKLPPLINLNEAPPSRSHDPPTCGTSISYQRGGHDASTSDACKTCKMEVEKSETRQRDETSIRQCEQQKRKENSSSLISGEEGHWWLPGLTTSNSPNA